MAESMIETPLSSGTDDPSFKASSVPISKVVNAGDPAAGYSVHNANNSLPAFDPKTFKPLGQMSTPIPAATPTPTQGLPPVDMGTFKPLGGPPKDTPLPAGQSEVGAAVGTEPLKTSDIPLPSKDTKGGYHDLKALPMDWSGLKGYGKDLLDAAKGVVTSATEGPKDDTEKAIQGIGGPAALPIYRALVGAGHTAKEATEIIGAVKDINQSADPLGAYAKTLQKTSSQGAAQATLALATEGALKAAPKVASGASDLAGAAYKNTKGLISHSTLQEPLQSGIRDIVADAAKTAPIEPAPKPNYAYRSRDAGEAGVPKAHAQSHGQATSDISQAKTYAEPGQRGAVGGGEEKPQEVVRVDLNKLKPEDYTTRTSGGKSWTDFKRPLAEDEVTKITPELEASEAAEKANVSSEPAPSKSIRKTVEQAGDKVHAASKADYKILDEATNGRFQRFRDKLANGRRQLQNLSGSEEDVQKEASILKGQKETEDAMQEAFEEAKAKGIDPKLIDRADANFRKSQALYDLDNAVKKSTKGAHPDHSTPELLKESPETLNPKMLHSRINALYDSGRLQDALGEEGANKLFDHTLEHSGAYDKIMRNRKLGMIGGGAVLGAAGAGGYVAHKLAGAALGQ
jgi:hypothetical protein